MLAYFNDHLEWLQVVRTKGKKQQRNGLAGLDLTPIDVDALNANVEREAAVTAEQMVYMAKGEAALFVHQAHLASELMDRVWDAVG